MDIKKFFTRQSKIIYIKINKELFEVPSDILDKSLYFHEKISKKDFKNSKEDPLIISDFNPESFWWIIRFIDTGDNVSEVKEEYIKDLDKYEFAYDQKKLIQHLSQEKIALTKDQQECFVLLRRFLLEDDGNWFYLQGFAGSGKTTVLSEFLKSLLHSPTPKINVNNTVICAPTHKAVRVIGNKLQKEFKCSTLHSFLCLEKTIDENGNVEFIQSKRYLKTIPNVRLVIIDECSMISLEVYKIIMDILGRFKLKIIFTGDPKQLPPVNEDLSKICKNKPNYNLTKILRHGGGILENATLIRKNQNKRYIEFKKFDNVRLLSSNQEWLDLINYSFKKNKDAHVLTWTNKRSKEINDSVREDIYGEKAQESEFLEGEKCIVTDTFVKKDKWFYTCDEIIVTKSEVIDLPYYNSLFNIPATSLKVYRLETDIKTDNSPTVLYRIHTDSLEIFEKLIKRMYARAKAGSRISKDRAKKLWKEMHEFKLHFRTPITYNYSTTCHKAQGSTYDVVFIDVKDISKNKDTVYKNQCLYTAFTRASKLVVVLN